MKITADNIIDDANPLIRTKSAKVQTPVAGADLELAEAMLQYVENSQDDQLCQQDNLKPAVGIAAIQTGNPVQLIAVVVPDPEDEEADLEFLLANPRIISQSVQSSYLSGGEGCLSVPNGHEGYVQRHARIKVRAWDVLNQAPVTFAASGFAAIVLQHEIDHLSGILYYDHIDSENPYKADEEAEVY
jgi:peptide deformylase